VLDIQLASQSVAWQTYTGEREK